MPISVTFSVFKQQEGNSNSLLFLDPNQSEMVLSERNTLTVVGTCGGRFISIEQNGSQIAEVLKHEAMKVSEQHFNTISSYL